MRKLSGIAVAFFAVLALFAAPGSGQTKTQPKTSKTKAGNPKAAKPKAKIAAKNSVPDTRYRRSNQKSPTPERYSEIEQALVDRGYVSGPADGKWGAAEVEALKRFQRDQSLPEDGKLGALTLMALGLGVKRSPVESASGPGQPRADE